MLRGDLKSMDDESRDRFNRLKDGLNDGKEDDVFEN
jgi:hypothetical protein